MESTVAGNDAPRVLIAEDDDSLRAMMVAILRRQNFEAATASDGQKAIDCMMATAFNVLVLDLMMPRVSGWDVIAWLRAHPDHRPHSVLVITASDRALTSQLDPQVVNAVFYKPFDIEQFGAYVASCSRRGTPDRRKKRIVTVKR
jgi:DNA-binding response OmpR family regulator